MTTEETQKQIDWKTHLKGWHDSGVSQSTYCRTHGLCISQFSYWKRKLEGSPNTSTVGRSQTSGFIPMQLATPKPVSRANIELTLPNGTTLSGITHDTLSVAQALLKGLQG